MSNGVAEWVAPVISSIALLISVILAAPSVIQYAKKSKQDGHKHNVQSHSPNDQVTSVLLAKLRELEEKVRQCSAMAQEYEKRMVDANTKYNALLKENESLRAQVSTLFSLLSSSRETHIRQFTKEEKARFSDWLAKHFTRTDLKSLAYKVGIDLESINEDGLTKDESCVALVDYADKRGMLSILDKVAVEERSNVQHW